MYIPDEWESITEQESPTTFVSGEYKAYRNSFQRHSCLISMGSDSERGVALSVPDMPGKLDGHGNGDSKALRESAVPACVVVQAKAQAETEGVAEPRARSSQAGLSVALPPIENEDAQESGRVR